MKVGGLREGEEAGKGFMEEKGMSTTPDKLVWLYKALTASFPFSLSSFLKSVPLRSFLCPCVAQYSNIYNSPWQMGAGPGRNEERRL